jgi:hypothetical protein
MSLHAYIHKAAAPAPAPKEVRGSDVPSMKAWFKPYPHQKRGVDKLFANKGRMILAHEMGLGKTVTAIYGMERMRHRGRADRAVVVVPSGLRVNFAHGGVKKFTNSSYQIVGSASEVRKRPGYVRPGDVRPDRTYTIISYAMFRRDPIGVVQRSGADTLILDEFHKVRNERASTFKAAMAARQHTKNFMGLTASLINNNPAEIATLMTISENRRDMTPAQFKRRFTQTIGFAQGFGGKTKKKVTGLKNVPELLYKTAPRIDYVDTSQVKGKTMPKKDLRNVPVPMSSEQYRLYQLALKRLGPVAEYITRRDPNITVKDADMIFAQITQARQLANSLHTGRRDVTPKQSAKRTPKVKKVLDDTAAHLKERPDNKVVLYSNLVRGGVDVLSAGLAARGIDHALFVGKGTTVGERKVTGISRQMGVASYKAGKKRVIILSGAGAEGLDLPNSTAFFALDGHFNPQRILQAEARARRLGGQAHRAPDKRVVKVRRYVSTVPMTARPGLLGRMIGRKSPRTTDEWMYDVAGRKHKVTERFYKAFREPSKYIRKYRDSKGKMRYVYPKKPGLLKRLWRRVSGSGGREQLPKAPRPAPVSQPGQEVRRVQPVPLRARKVPPRPRGVQPVPVTG